MSLTLRAITFFVEDMEKATSFYSDVLRLTPADIRKGWSAYNVSKDFNIAFHKGKLRHPRLSFTTNGDISSVRDELNARGAKLGPLKEIPGGFKNCKGRDKDGLMIEISNRK